LEIIKAGNHLEGAGLHCGSLSAPQMGNHPPKIAFGIFECKIRRDCDNANIDECDSVDVFDCFEAKAMFNGVLPPITVSSAFYARIGRGIWSV
jgi:hypothetical protein